MWIDELGPWLLLAVLLMAISLAALMGWLHDRHSLPRRAAVLRADHWRAGVMVDYYTRVHGSES